jgi:hypothetical protein
LIEAGNLYTTSGVVTARHLYPVMSLQKKTIDAKIGKTINRLGKLKDIPYLVLSFGVKYGNSKKNMDI